MLMSWCSKGLKNNKDTDFQSSNLTNFFVCFTLVNEGICALYLVDQICHAKNFEKCLLLVQFSILIYFTKILRVRRS